MRTHLVNRACASSRLRRAPQDEVKTSLTLYAVEADIRGLSADERRQARQRRSKPLVDALRLWLEAQLAAVSGKSTIAAAIRYALSRWDGLARFLDDGRVEIDSNVVERSIRPIALGRRTTSSLAPTAAASTGRSLPRWSRKTAR